MPEHHDLMGGKLHVYRRERGPYWQCSAFLGGCNRRISTHEESLSLAKDFAEDWYLELRGKHRRGEIKKQERTFKAAAAQFEKEFPIIMQGQRSPRYLQRKAEIVRLHINPFFW